MKTRSVGIFMVLVILSVLLSPAFAVNINDPQFERKYDPGSSWARLSEKTMNDIGEKSLALRLLEDDFDRLTKRRQVIVSDWESISRVPTEEMRAKYKADIQAVDEELRLIATAILAVRGNLNCMRQLRAFLTNDGRSPIEDACLAK